MADYERLTRYMQVGNKVVQVIPQRKERIQNYVDRLFDLEDKIESGELISKKEVERLKSENVALRNEADENAALSMENKMRADRLEKENAALRERLDKAVELPCRVGDKVYCIHGMSNPEMLEWQVNEIRITDHNYMLQLGRAGTKDYRNEASQFYGKWWFTELEAAEACLAELEEKKE